jgi:hypothetical protein
MFRAVRLGAGRHQVRFRYRPWTVRAGAAASALGLIAALVLALRLAPGRWSAIRRGLPRGARD